MLQRHCDRCGKLIKKDNEYFEVQLDRWRCSMMKEFDPNEVYPQLYDLCKDCVKDFKLFFKEKQ